MLSNATWFNGPDQSGLVGTISGSSVKILLAHIPSVEAGAKIPPHSFTKSHSEGDEAKPLTLFYCCHLQFIIRVQR
jgi:hypothetical protein